MHDLDNVRRWLVRLHGGLHDERPRLRHLLRRRHVLLGHNKRRSLHVLLESDVHSRDLSDFLHFHRRYCVHPLRQQLVLDDERLVFVQRLRGRDRLLRADARGTILLRLRLGQLLAADGHEQRRLQSVPDGRRLLLDAWPGRLRRLRVRGELLVDGQRVPGLVDLLRAGLRARLSLRQQHGRHRLHAMRRELLLLVELDGRRHGRVRSMPRWPQQCCQHDNWPELLPMCRRVLLQQLFVILHLYQCACVQRRHVVRLWLPIAFVRCLFAMLCCNADICIRLYLDRRFCVPVQGRLSAVFFRTGR